MSISFLVLSFAITEACNSQITITFSVDMSGQTITAQGVHIAGQFALVNAISITQDWQPGAPGSQLTLVSGSTYSIQVVFPSSAAGKKLEFEFVRSDIWFGSEDYSEGNPGDANAHIDNSCGVPDGTGGFNRIITIPACGGQFISIWNYCGNLSALSPPSLTVSSSSEICPGASVQLSATSSGNLEWSPSTGLSCTQCDNPIAAPTISTLYKVTSTTANCSVTDSVLITVDMDAVNAGPDQQITSGSSTQLNVAGSANYIWQPTSGLSCANCSSPIASPPVTTSYVVSATSANGCKSTDTVTVFVSKSPCVDIFLPNAFTPNNDGVNDKFGLLSGPGIYPSSAVFRIYNRWGEVIFETRDLTRKWDGTFHGITQATGNYVYYISFRCSGKTTEMKGIVTLIR
ncbi:MAG TPA: gliding motility-associated C-terminal domain-containing protein [Chitinophagaceae bacterium]|nr:gliding motility-associated C-terminal domain-containing protein [Chitinophagaceae bacterium]